MTLLLLVNKKLAIVTALTQLTSLVLLVYLVLGRKKYPVISQFIGKHGLLFTFIISLAATVSSLFYSNVAGFAPCDLCWLQRIFMYPLVFITGLALLKRDTKITDYILTLSVVGAVISLYHNYIYYFNQGLNVFCQLGGSSVSCVKRYVFEFGYITIPMMALTAFVLIIIIMLFVRHYERTGQ